MVAIAVLIAKAGRSRPHAAPRARVDALMVVSSRFMNANLSYGPDLNALATRAAWYVDRILKGTRPADLPVEQPTKFELVINAKTAKVLGLVVPPSLLRRADHIVE